MAKNEQKRVLIVDDHEPNRRLLSEHVEMSGCIPVTAADGLQALSEIHASRPDMVILDLLLPKLDGISVLKQLRRNPDFGQMPIMVVSAFAELDRVRECIDLGVSDFLPKPFLPQALSNRLKQCLANRSRRGDEPDPFRPREFAREIVSSLGMMGIATAGQCGHWSDALVELVERFTPETRAHLDRTSEFCRILSRQLTRDRRFAAVIDAEFMDVLSKTAGLHDIGKLAVPESILSKPGPLDVEESRIMRRHVTVGAEILREIYRRFPDEGHFALTIELTLYHHERWDGHGYPFGLSGESIPLAGRIMAVADVYDALRSVRSYKRAFSHEESRDIILTGAGTQFDPAVVAGFLACEHELEVLFNANRRGMKGAAKGRMAPRRDRRHTKAHAMTA